MGEEDLAVRDGMCSCSWGEEEGCSRRDSSSCGFRRSAREVSDDAEAACVNAELAVSKAGKQREALATLLAALERQMEEGSLQQEAIDTTGLED